MELLKNIFDDCNLNVQRYERVHGGDINDTYCLFTPDGKYFLKVNDTNKYPLMFQREAEGLDLLRKDCMLIIPQVIKFGSVVNKQYLILEWLERGTPQNDVWKNFGERLAMMHIKPQPAFGLNEDNYIGSLRQINTSQEEWPSFYAQSRIMPLVKVLFDRGSYTSKDLNAAHSLCNELNDFFPVEPAALLHGDLWSGNYMIHSAGYAAIFDPAVYRGHREMDIGMTRLFGGFDKRFYNAYNEVYPLAKDWEKRVIVTQLYPLLVHAVLFGGHYISNTKEIFMQLGR